MVVSTALGAAIVGCAVVEDFIEPTVSSKDTPQYTRDQQQDSIFGPGGANLRGIFDPSDKGGAAGGAGIGVNSFLWRASLDTVSFMPLTSADPFGGVIITDWYSPPEAPSERFKMNIYILGRQLRADGLRVAVFRQEQAGEGSWINASVKTETSINLENQISQTRAAHRGLSVPLLVYQQRQAMGKLGFNGHHQVHL